MKKDWILTNIENIMRQKGLFAENVSRDIGISKGEFSKILSGQRQDYPKHLPKIAESLNVSYQDLVKENALSLYNYGEVKDNGTGNVGHLHQTIDKLHYESVIKDLRDVIAEVRVARENWKAKYYRIKEKLEKLEKEQ